MTKKIDLPDAARVNDWLKVNKLQMTCRVRMQPIPDTSDVRVTVEHNSDEIQSMLLTKFCMALVKGEI